MCSLTKFEHFPNQKGNTFLVTKRVASEPFPVFAIPFSCYSPSLSIHQKNWEENAPFPERRHDHEVEDDAGDGEEHLGDDEDAAVVDGLCHVVAQKVHHGRHGSMPCPFYTFWNLFTYTLRRFDI